MQFDERVHRYPADADLHACARDRIEHPRRHNRDDAGLRFDLHEPPGDYAARCGGGKRDARRGDASDNGPRLPARYGQNDQEMALGRKNALFAGSESGARTWAILASLINTAKLNDLDPQTYLADVLERMISGRTPVNRLDELLAWNWKAARAALATAA